MELVPFALHCLKKVVDSVKIAASFKEDRFVFIRKLCKRLIDIKSFFRCVLHHLFPPPPVCQFVPGVDSALRKRKVLIRDYKILIVVQDIPESFALRACSDGVVE